MLSCNTTPKQVSVADDAICLPEGESAFFENLASLCGKSFKGKEVYIKPGRESWADKKFVMRVTLCDKDQIHIPFHLDDDHSRTWMFLIEDGRLRFRHDHRHKDGTPEDENLYGGYSDGKGTAYHQKFPNDDYTFEMLADSITRRWELLLDEKQKSLAYLLFLNDTLVFEAAFDLSKEIEN
jgi:hypothetical protein